METITSLLALALGLLVRLAVPLTLTALLISLLRKLDARWQREAQATATGIAKPECWKIKDCPPAERAQCIGATSPLPCWQAYRLPNGYLHEKCLTCDVFIHAPLPPLQTEPRRM